MFDREREDALYATVPWVLSASLSYLPGQVVFPALYAIIVYFMTGFWREHLAVNLFSFIAQVPSTFPLLFTFPHQSVIPFSFISGHSANT